MGKGGFRAAQECATGPDSPFLRTRFLSREGEGADTPAKGPEEGGRLRGKGDRWHPPKRIRRGKGRGEEPGTYIRLIFVNPLGNISAHILESSEKIYPPGIGTRRRRRSDFPKQGRFFKSGLGLFVHAWKALLSCNFIVAFISL